MVSLNPTSHLQWDSLPSHLHELILAHLPVSYLSRLRLLNRAWLSVLTSPHFQDLHRRLHPRLRPSFLVYNHAVKINVLIAPPALAGDTNPRLEDAPLWQNLPVPVPFVRELAGDGHSLVCLRSHATSNAFFVGNVCNKQWKILPDPPRAPLLSKLWAVVTQASPGTSDAYSIVLLQLSSPSLYIDIYSSEKKGWTQRTVPKAAGGKGSLITFSSNAASIGGILYAVQVDSRSVVTYDVRRDSWKRLESRLPNNLVFQVPKEGGFIQVTPQVMQGCRGKILLVGAAVEEMPELTMSSDSIEKSTEKSGDGDCSVAEKDASGFAERIKGINYAVVWEMDWCSKEWKEMARAPWHMCVGMVEEAMELRKASVTPVKFSGRAELVIAMAAGSRRALQFDAIAEKWSWLDLPDAVNCDLSLCVDQPIPV